MGGILLALSMLFIAKFYTKILNIKYFFRISLFVEIVMLLMILFFLIVSYSYTTALLIYIGYQVTFSFGSYLVRAETILFKKSMILTFLDVNKQKGYLAGMFVAFVFYEALEYFYEITSSQDQVFYLHILLFLLECLILYKLFRSFKLYR